MAVTLIKEGEPPKDLSKSARQTLVNEQDIKAALIAPMHKELQLLMLDEGDKVRQKVEADIWVNPGNATPHVDGSPSESTGLSSKAWESVVRSSPSDVSVGLIINEGAVPYARYVRFSGEAVGQSLLDVNEYWERAVIPDLDRKVEQIITDLADSLF